MGHIDRTEELVDSTGSPWSAANPLPVAVISGGGGVSGGTVDQGAAGVSAWPVSLASLPSLAAGANAIGTVGVTSLPALPAGSNAIGTVSVASLPALPTGANTIGGVNQSGTWTVGLSAGANTIGKTDQGVGGLSAWKVDGSAVTQPVSGTVAVSGLPALPAGSNTIGKVDQGAAGAAAWKVDGSAVTQPVSGSVTVTGGKTNNNAAPGATNVGTLGAVATAAAPSSTEGNQVALSTDLAGNVRVLVAKVPGTISSANSSTATLTSGSVFTGTSEDISGYAAVVVNVLADQAGTFSPQFSSDGSNWDFQGSHAIAAGVGQMFVFRPGAKFYRAVYTNGGTNQGAFRFQTVYHQDDVNFATAQTLVAGMANPTTAMVGANLLVQPSGGTTWSPAAADSSARQIVVVNGLPTAAAVGDGFANPTTTQMFTFPGVWNGATWDHWKDMAAAQAQTVFTGVPAMAPFYLDTTGTPSVRRGVTGASCTTGVAGTQVPGSASLVWDGTVFRPQLGDTSGRTVVSVAKVAGTISTVNSTTSPLNNAAVFTGTAEDVSAYSSVSVNVFADQSSAASGLSLQWSSNGTNWDIANTYTVTLNVGQTILLPPRAQFFRVVYTNGGVTQTSFRLQTVFHQTQVSQDVGTSASQVQGTAASGTAIVGNPVLMAGWDGANAIIPVFAAPADTAGQSSGTLRTNAYVQAYNGASWDRVRSNVDATLLASAARTTTQGPTTLTTYNLGAIIFVLDMTAVGTGSVTLTISEVDPASGKSILLLSGAAVTTNSTNVYTIDPMLTAAVNSIAKARTPRTLSWTVTANNVNSAQYSLGAMELMP